MVQIDHTHNSSVSERSRKFYLILIENRDFMLIVTTGAKREIPL